MLLQNEKYQDETNALVFDGIFGSGEFCQGQLKYVDVDDDIKEFRYEGEFSARFQFHGNAQIYARYMKEVEIEVEEEYEDLKQSKRLSEKKNKKQAKKTRLVKKIVKEVYEI